ncbi:sugar ABC transporter ATP-binding protein [Ruegeria sp. 2012CJ41-6]|uniref:Sugar ABC transporter ATP-binding protein n=1 Tax=Ruegeria spongiae TaxID=2942209 RepID=A0ABT0Q4P4_9RHOB|nr:sugar ABC transporter ATP-binding protein [Ruegeria spongiae]MCL6284158.1 sugar ABC transporter ATP-binding protein [Ruegeria spongiae]
MTDQKSPLIELRAVTKKFPGVIALKDIDFDLKKGETHVLLGENGAGKSTLINILAGSFPPNAGSYLINGVAAKGLTPHKARLSGISPVFQEFSLAPELTVMQNMFLGREIRRLGVLDNAAMKVRAEEVLSELGFEINTEIKVGELSRARQQMVEIAKALLQDVQVLILDEPTASLTDSEAEKLFELVERLKTDGCGIIYVSHRMAEIRKIGDRVTVLRDGRKIGTVTCADTSDADMIEMMTGRKVDTLFPKVVQKPGKEAMRVEKLTSSCGGVKNVSLTMRHGEIVGIAGLVGSGKSEIARLIFGLESIATGAIFLAAKTEIRNPSPRKMLRNGICYLPSDRVGEGLAMDRPIRENATIAALDTEKFNLRGLMRRKNERDAANKVADRFSLRPLDIERRVEALSGGNRQKVMLARGILRDVEVFLFDEPTVGVDVGAKAQIYHIINELVENGAAVLLISSELPEITNLCNRTYVMRLGEIVGELLGDEVTENNVLNAIFDDHTRMKPDAQVPA